MNKTANEYVFALPPGLGSTLISSVSVSTTLAMLATLTVVFLSALSSTIAFPSQGLANATKSDDLITCLHAKSVPFETEVNGDFGALSRAYNLAFHYVPDAIALPSTVSHVRDAVVCADRANVKVQARCGGHSYAAFGLGGTSGSLVVDMGNFHGIDYDENTGIAKVGGGVRLGNLATALYNNWNRAMPHGTCPGYALHVLITRIASDLVAVSESVDTLYMAAMALAPVNGA